MGFLDRLLGREENPQTRPAPDAGPASPPAGDPDQQAVDRYQYLLRTAPPDRIEAAHAEAFAQLNADQRRLALEQLTTVAAPGEAPADDSPGALARSATRTEVQQPGALHRAFGGGPAGALPGMGTVLLTSVAGAFIGTAVAQSLLGPGLDGSGGEGDSGGGEGDDSGGEGGDAGTDAAEGGSSADGGGWWGGDAGGSTDAGFDGGGFDGGF